jgi:MFS family permease
MGVWVVMLPLLIFLFRNRPEDIGQVPDGGPPADGRTEATSADELNWGLTLQQAFRTRTYWILLAMHMSWAMVGTAIVFHIVSLFEQQGLGKPEVAVFFTYFALSMALAQFIGGLLADRVVLNVLLLTSMVGMTFSVAFLPFVDSTLGVINFAAASGLSQGLFIVLGQTVWARYYGRPHLGEIRGTIWTACVAGSSVGPFIMGLAKDWLGGYGPAIWLFVSVYGLLSLAALFVTPVRGASPVHATTSQPG